MRHVSQYGGLALSLVHPPQRFSVLSDLEHTPQSMPQGAISSGRSDSGAGSLVFESDTVER